MKQHAVCLVLLLSSLLIFSCNARQVRRDSSEDHPQLLDVKDTSLDPYAFETSELPTNPKLFPSVGNGHLATTVYRDAVFVNGIYSGYTGWSHRARIPAVHSSNFTLNSTLGPACTTAQRLHRLDLQNGTFTEIITYPSVIVTYRVYAHQFYNRILVTEVILERNSACESCDCTDEIVISRTDLGSLPVSGDLNLTASVAVPGCTGCWSQSGTIKEIEIEGAPVTTVSMFWKAMPTTFTLSAGTDNTQFIYIFSVDQSATVAKENFDAAIALDAQLLLSNHTAAFRSIWTRGTIDVTGDLHLNKVIHGSFYYLYTSLPAHPTLSPNNQFSGLSPGGLPNGANNTDYQGHVFWDMETWMYPPILMFRPDLAKDMLSYRISGMGEAQKRAASGGYKGARFPWESAFTGVEVTPVICVACRENQQHITVDIAYAARQYLVATQDFDWLTTPQADTAFTGFDFLLEMANFWQSRPSLNGTTNRYDINGVMPPDEHQESINNSIYTNVGASYAIHFARYAACMIQKPPTTVPDSWINIAQNLAFTYQREKRYHEEFQGYDYTVITNTTDPRGVKQADVVMLGYPFLWDMPEDVRKKDLEWYETVTHPDGPAMTWSIHAIGWLDLEDFDKANAMFVRSYDAYTREPFNVWTEVQSGDGAVNFITGQGGFLQGVIFGYGGMRLETEELDFKKPRLPPGTTNMVLRNINYFDMEFDMEVTTTEAVISVTKGGSHSFTLTAGSLNAALTPGSVTRISLQSFKIRASALPACTITKPEIDVDYSPLPVVVPLSASRDSSMLALVLAALCVVRRIIFN